ncbi:MAG: tetraacyldisaccharide 4'-kinase [Hyphomicrobiaceae bacterium]
MPADEPWWWYAPASPARRLTCAALTPLGWLYGAATLHRMRQSGYRSALPVICVGNLTAGGSGKTPMTRWIADRLSRQFGVRTVVLSRGYGGRLKGPIWVEASAHTAKDVGDEPRMLAAGLPVVIARDRAAGALLIEARVFETPLEVTEPGARQAGAHAVAGRSTAIVMDDGLQNPHLVKDLRIAVVNARRGLGNWAVIPAGPLRAPASAQLADVDLMVLAGGTPGIKTDLRGRFERLRRDLPTVSMQVEADQDDLAWLKGRRVLAFAGIADPERFFMLVRSAGADVVATRAFPDHATYNARDAADLLAEARYCAAHLVTTEKDAARFHCGDDVLAELAALTRVIRIEAKISDRDSAVIDRLLAQMLERPADGVRGCPV